MARTRSSGFTLLEALVIVSIIGLLVALLLPTVQAAREAGRRVECGNHLRQLGIALSSYAEALGCLPPGRIKLYDPRLTDPRDPCSSLAVDKSFELSLLPYIEGMPVYNAINQSLTVLGPENSTIHVISVSQFACPSDWLSGQPRGLNENALAAYGLFDPPSGRRPMVFTSYAGCAGSFESLGLPLPLNACSPQAIALSQNDGCFNDRLVTYASITDGTSHTLFLVERSCAMIRRVADFSPAALAQYGWYITGNWGDTICTTFYPPNAYKTVSLSAITAQFNSPSSAHPDGLNVLMGDGSTRFIKETIQTWDYSQVSGQPVGIIREPEGWWSHIPTPGVWQALATRAGNEVNSPF